MILASCLARQCSMEEAVVKPKALKFRPQSSKQTAAAAALAALLGPLQPAPTLSGTATAAENGLC
jgi:hypothetical protein